MIFSIIAQAFGLVFISILLLKSYRDVYWYVGLAVSIVSFIFWVMASIQIGKSFSLKPEAKELVTTGLYSKIRHPIYVFSTLVFLGVTVGLKSRLMLIFVVILTIVELIRARLEEKVLLEKFGQRYLDYKEKTLL